MNNKYINFYNNLVSLTRNKILYEKFTSNDTFSQRLTILMFHFAFFLRNFKEPEHIEQLIYAGGFPKPSDKELMEDFHRIEEPSYRIKIARNIEDERFRLFAERLVCQMYPSEAPEDMQKRYGDFLSERLNEEGPWGSTEKILAEIEKLKDSEDQNILIATESFIKQRN